MPAIDTNNTQGVVTVTAHPVAAPDPSPHSSPHSSPKPPAVSAATGIGNTPADGPEVPVWDRFVRSFHWLLVIGVSALVASAHFGLEELHMLLGMFVLSLLAARLVWGFVGSPYARFASFAVSPFEALRYLGDIVRGRPRAYLGHNPAGGWMVFTLLALLLVLGLTGLVMQATLEFEGPLVDLLRGLNDRAVREVAIAHRLAIKALYLLVPLHLLGVLLASVQHGENLVLAMITGRKRPLAGQHPASLPTRNESR